VWAQLASWPVWRGSCTRAGHASWALGGRAGGGHRRNVTDALIQRRLTSAPPVGAYDDLGKAGRAKMQAAV
jgi:hypothetical protein